LRIQNNVSVGAGVSWEIVSFWVSLIRYGGVQKINIFLFERGPWKSYRFLSVYNVRHKGVQEAYAITPCKK
jgi:hypothetical protein